MPRFFVSKEELHESFMVLTGENAAHAKVLRLKNGDEVTVCDGDGTDYRCTVSDVANGQISLVVHAAVPAESEADVQCSVYMAFAKADKFEHVIQKATELGASELVCFPSVRCVSRPDKKSLAKKLERWQKIAACRRTVPPWENSAGHRPSLLSSRARTGCQGRTCRLLL